MADPQYQSTPQAFTFANRSLVGELVSFSTKNQRRHVVHQFLKRRGARVEDMEQGPRALSVRLHFIGPTAASDYTKFSAAVADDPRGLLVHPIAGRWQAFCEGPNESVDFDRSTNEIQVTCDWVEDQLDARSPRDVPDVATAAQDVTARDTTAKIAVAVSLVEDAKAGAFEARALSLLDAFSDTIDELTSPVDAAGSAIRGAVGAGARIVGKLSAVESKSAVLSQNIESYVAAATDLFNGGDQPSARADETATLLGVVVSDAQGLSDALIDAAPSPAGAAEAVGSVEELASSCYVLQEALLAARPPTITVTVSELTDLVTFCVRRYPDDPDPIARAFDVAGMNRIPNPAAIPAGTLLRVPSQ